LKAIRYDHGESRITVESHNSFLRNNRYHANTRELFPFLSSIEIILVTALLAAVAYRDGEIRRKCEYSITKIRQDVRDNALLLIIYLFQL